jgi:hypothetical protein
VHHHRGLGVSRGTSWQLRVMWSCLRRVLRRLDSQAMADWWTVEMIVKCLGSGCRLMEASTKTRPSIGRRS